MPQIQSTMTVARIATQWPGTIRIFQRHGIDFCCRGGRPLAEACDDRGLELEELLEEFANLDATSQDPEVDWPEAPLSHLVEHIQHRYHDRLREDLPGLTSMVTAVIAAHGEKHPEVRQIAAVLADLRRDLEVHTQKEEKVLFPAILALEEASHAHQAPPVTLHLEAPISRMEVEHEEAGRALAQLRRLSRDFQPPAGACPTFRGLYHGLEELESDTHRHVHLENNILFPRAVALQAEVQNS